jgi:hypothetical protein
MVDKPTKRFGNWKAALAVDSIGAFNLNKESDL